MKAYYTTPSWRDTRYVSLCAWDEGPLADKVFAVVEVTPDYSRFRSEYRHYALSAAREACIEQARLALTMAGGVYL